jgi:cobalt-zinc-cadmium efflux system membrane fusion protein
MYVTALIDIGNQLTPAVPVDAVVRSEGKDYIFMISEPERETVKDENDKKNTEQTFQFKKVEVVTGVSELGYIQITLVDKIPKDAKIVTKGAFYILSKSQGLQRKNKLLVLKKMIKWIIWKKIRFSP